MNYLIMFLVILAVLTLMFFAGYAMAYKRFSYYVARLREQLAEALGDGENVDARAVSSVNSLNQVVSNKSKSSQHPTQAAAPQRVAAAAVRDYPSSSSPATRLAAANANANTGKNNQVRTGQPGQRPPGAGQSAAPAPATRKRGEQG